MINFVVDDWELFDNVETVTWASGSVSAQVRALGRVTQQNEPGVAGGRATVATKDWNLRAASVPQRPTVGDTITDAAGVVWVVDSVQLLTFSSRYKLPCRVSAGGDY